MLLNILKRLGILAMFYLSAYFVTSYIDTKNMLALALAMSFFAEAFSAIIWLDKESFEKARKQ